MIHYRRLLVLSLATLGTMALLAAVMLSSVQAGSAERTALQSLPLITATVTLAPGPTNMPCPFATPEPLWVEPVLRRQGLGARLVRAFEGLAREHGCAVAYLETFNFQAPSLYRSLGYVTVHEHAVYPHGIVRHLMVHAMACPLQAADQVPQ